MSHQPQPATYRLGDPSSYACAWWCHGWYGLINGQPKQRALGKGRSLHIGAGPVQESCWTMLCLTPPLVDQIARRTIGVPMGSQWGFAARHWSPTAKLSDSLQIESRTRTGCSSQHRLLHPNGPTGPNQRFQGSMAQVLGFLWICYLLFDILIYFVCFCFRCALFLKDIRMIWQLPESTEVYPWRVESGSNEADNVGWLVFQDRTEEGQGATWLPPVPPESS